MQLDGIHHITCITADASRKVGEALRLPPQHEQLRAHLERSLTPLANPPAATDTAARAPGLVGASGDEA
jgi:hypothetical protein